jgi:hypothetical protein
MNATTTPRIEHYGNVAWAVITEKGVAVWPSSTEAIRAIRTDNVCETAEDEEFYDEHGPWYFCEEMTREATE